MQNAPSVHSKRKYANRTPEDDQPHQQVKIADLVRERPTTLKPYEELVKNIFSGSAQSFSVVEDEDIVKLFTQ